ncbi:MaoC family dehydratase [Bosea sp. (in: a-proteobacteria)]|uniref:MaoC family dehydratase n=1 Tax=Bosea sp. (in: a-proteobacteria) TaxID=1871050 RepID=UPI003B3BBC8D
MLPERSIVISQALIDEYAALSGDYNPLHVDPAAGEAAGFGGPIAHGCIPMEPLCQALQAFLEADELPADTAIRLRYRAPSRPGDVIRSRAVVTGLAHAGSREVATIGFACLNQRDETVLDGEVEVSA